MPSVNEDPVATGRAGGLKSGEARRAKAALRKDLRARQVFVENADAVAKALVDAALGRGDFEALDPKERLGPMKTVLEMGVGRARAQDAAELEDDEEEKQGIRFGVRQADGDVQPEEDPDDAEAVEDRELLAGGGADSGVGGDDVPGAVPGES